MPKPRKSESRGRSNRGEKRGKTGREGRGRKGRKGTKATKGTKKGKGQPVSPDGSNQARQQPQQPVDPEHPQETGREAGHQDRHAPADVSPSATFVTSTFPGPSPLGGPEGNSSHAHQPDNGGESVGDGSLTEEERQALRERLRDVQPADYSDQERRIIELWAAYPEMPRDFIRDIVLSPYGDQSHLLGTTDMEDLAARSRGTIP